MNYDKMSDVQKKEFLVYQYEKLGNSFQEIAKELGTYSNKVRRDAIKLNIKIRDKSTAQKTALSTGRSKHPTAGKERSDEVKSKIGHGVMNSWADLEEQELKKRKDKAKANWNNLSDDVKENMLKQANNAVRNASKTGSKLEKFLLRELLNAGMNVDFHKEHSLLNTKLQIDIFLPKYSIAIEVDGPSHFEPVWGEDVLKRNKKYDNKKTGLILGKGLFLIRIKQSKDFSTAKAQVIFNELYATINKIINKSITQDKVIYLGD
jgi:very-short-patch-repair endonuclease